jgi:hypothetical protein
MIRMIWEKMMKWGWDYNRNLRESNIVDSLPVASDDTRPDMEKAIRFSVLPARGGCVLETRTYDKKEREWDVTSHVIPDGTDVAKSVGDIVAMELLRR